MKTRKVDEHNIVNGLYQLELKANDTGSEVFAKIKERLDARVMTLFTVSTFDNLIPLSAVRYLSNDFAIWPRMFLCVNIDICFPAPHIFD
jgi:hypothetical protein